MNANKLIEVLQRIVQKRGNCEVEILIIPESTRRACVLLPLTAVAGHPNPESAPTVRLYARQIQGSAPHQFKHATVLRFPPSSPMENTGGTFDVIA